MDLTVLNRRKGSVKAQITKLLKFSAADAEKTDIVDIVNKLENLKNLERKIEELQLDYYKTLKDEEVQACETEFEGIDEEIQNLKVSFKRFLDSKNSRACNSTNLETVSNTALNQKLKVKLPEIPLPKFNGSYEDWNNFKLQFNSIIARNEALSDTEKLFYLQSCLVGSAKQVQSAVDTYDSLFNALQNRYENKRLIINSHMNVLLSLENIAVESADKLRLLLDTVLKHVRALKVMEIEMNKFSEMLLINIVSQKLDRITRKEYEMTLKTSDLPDWDKFISFLQERCQILENLQKGFVTNAKPKLTLSQNKVKNFVLNSKNDSCKLCKKSHALYDCDMFLKMTPLQRFDVVKKYKLCMNCLSKSHLLIDCKCKYSCRFCKSKHNYLLHRNKIGDSNCESDTAQSVNTLKENVVSVENETNPTNLDNATSCVHSLSSCITSKKRIIVLATAIIYVKDISGCLIKARALLDGGSQVCVASQSFANNLGLKQKRSNITISSLSGKSIYAKKEMSVEISNCDQTFSTTVDLLILPKVTDLMPTAHIDISQIEIPSNITLADPNFYKPGKIDLLIGAEVFFDILRNNTIRTDESLIFKETVFGYIASGAVKGVQETTLCGFISQLDELENSVKQFWELENLEDSPTLKDEELQCERYFGDTYYRDNTTGKYTVSLPLRENVELGSSELLAKKQLESLWKRLNKNPEMKKLYTDFMDEYLRLGHMREVEYTSNLKYVMPHHGVLRPDNTTTRLRVVFNASAPSSNGTSLNNCLLKGGVVQEDLFSILLRFRRHKIAFVADIQKMYRQIWVNPNQCNLQTILWKNNSTEEPKLFELLTVTYGTACAPFLATRVLRQLALDERDNFPLASAAALTDFYVDDILTGSDDTATALELQHQLIGMLKMGGMDLHKWCSNEEELLAHVSLNQKEYKFEESKNNMVKTLGLRWDPKEDNFLFNVTCSSESPTKRSVLSEIARLFDPLGLLGPIITQAKKFLQNLWQIKIDWDQELPDDEKRKWEKFRKNLFEIKSLEIHRYILTDFVDIVQLHGFSDASREAYGAVVYLRCLTTKGKIKVSLLCSKSRVSPLKEITIPRLELCGSVLLAKLAKKVCDALKLHIDQVCLWTDSKIVLAWIVKPVSQLKLFVKNRVKIIQELTELDCWGHVSSKDNPADVISRGIDGDKIKSCQLWWFGPPFLHQEIEIKPCKILPDENSDLFKRELKEIPSEVCTLLQGQKNLDIINNCSSFTKLQRIISWCLRFIKNARHPQRKTSGCLTSGELSRALTCIVQNVQASAFHEEIQCLKKGKPLPNCSKLLNLCPFLDSQDVLRVGGRLRNSNLELNQKHQILLPNDHNFTYLVINYFHVLHFHIGPEGTLAFIRSTFWIVRGRNIIRKLIKQCIVCLKVSAECSQQIMADLPSARITPSKVFNKVGIDFCGPFTIKTFAGRSKNLNKCYVCIFICLAVKAVHFEVVHGLTTEAFLAALKRFIARRNKPSELFSDNGSNFVGANNELRKIVKDLLKGKSIDKIENYVASEGVKWNFNPPSSPHFGGLWEAGIKSLKYHLKRIVGDTILSHDEFFTLVTQIEAVLNSRPLCPLSNDPNDISALTPAHFLVGSSLVALPDPNYLDTPTNRLSRWQLVQKCTQLFWKKWSTEYLNRLQQRPKWYKGKVNFKEGDVVLCKNSANNGYLRWHLARIIKTHPGKDDIVRVVTIKDKTGVYQRPVTKIVSLPFVN